MSQTVGSIGLDLEINKSPFERQINGLKGYAQKSANGIENSFKGAFGKVGGFLAGTFVIKKLIDFSKQSIDLASDLAEVQNVVDVTFGAMSEDVNNFAKNALQQFGLSELSAKKYASTMGAMLKSSGLAGQTMKEMSKNITALSADMASFYNLNNDMAFNKVLSGLSGEIMPLRELGVNMSVANIEAYALSQGITKAYNAMSQAEQVMLRYNYLLSVTKDAQGDFARTSDSWANQTKILTEQWRIFMGTMGSAFMQVLTPVVKFLNIVMSRIITLANYFKALVNLIFGVKNEMSSVSAVANDIGGGSSELSDMSSGLGDVADSAKNAGKSAKKAGKDIKGALASFDQLNTITQQKSNDSSASGGGGGGVGSGGGGGGADFGSLTSGTLTTPEIDTASLDKFINKLKIAFNFVQDSTFLKNLKTIFDESKKILTGAWDEVKPEFETSFKNLFSGLNNITDFFIKDVAVGLGTDLSTALAEWFMINSPTIQSNLINILRNISSGIFSAGNVFNNIGDILKASLEQAKPNIVLAFTDLVTAGYTVFDTNSYIITDIFNNIWKFIDTWITDKKTELVNALTGLWVNSANTTSLFSNIVTDIFNSLKVFWVTWGNDILEIILKPIKTLGNMILTTWNNLTLPIWQSIISNLKILWDGGLKDLIDNLLGFIGRIAETFGLIWDRISPVLERLWEYITKNFSNGFIAILDIITPLINGIIGYVSSIIGALNGVLDFLLGVFSGDWSRAWKGIKDVFSNIWEGVGSIFKGVFNSISVGIEKFINNAISQINKLINNINSAISIINTIPGVNISKLTPLPSVSIPKLARGGIVDTPTLAMIGERGKEAVVPLENTAFVDTLASAVANAVVSAMSSMQINSGSNNQSQPVILKVGETELGRVVINAINGLQKQSSVQLISI